MYLFIYNQYYGNNKINIILTTIFKNRKTPSLCNFQLTTYIEAQCNS